MRAKVITVVHRDSDIFWYAHVHCQLVATMPDGATMVMPAGTVLREIGVEAADSRTGKYELERGAATNRLPRYLARAQQPDGVFENVGELTTLGEAKKSALVAQEKRGGPVHVVDEGGEVIWSSEMSVAIFEPTPEEVASCVVLAEVAGLPMREVVLVLSRKLTVDRQALAALRLTRDELSKANSELREDADRERARAREATIAVARLAGASLILADATKLWGDAETAETEQAEAFAQDGISGGARGRGAEGGGIAGHRFDQTMNVAITVLSDEDNRLERVDVHQPLVAMLPDSSTVTLPGGERVACGDGRRDPEVSGAHVDRGADPEGVV